MSDPPTPTSARRKPQQGSAMASINEDNENLFEPSRASIGRGGRKRSSSKKYQTFQDDSADPFGPSMKESRKNSRKTMQPTRLDLGFDADNDNNNTKDISQFFASGGVSAAAPELKHLNLSPRGTPPGSPRPLRNSGKDSKILLWEPFESPRKQNQDLSKITPEEFSALATKGFQSSTVPARQPQPASVSTTYSASIPAVSKSLPDLPYVQQQTQQPQQQPQQPQKPSATGIVFSTMGVPHGFELVREMGVVSGSATLPLPRDLKDYKDAIEQARSAAQQDLFHIAQSFGANAVLQSG